MYIVGLTGGIACGKSTVSQWLREKYNVCILDADTIAGEMSAPGKSLWQSYVNRYGPKRALLPDGQLNRAAIGRIVFADPNERAWMNRMAHPLVRAETLRRLQVLQEQANTTVVLDVPLFFEAGYAKYVDDVWYVYASKALRENRVSERDKIDSDYAKRKIDSQLTLEEIQKKYQIRIIDNEGSIDDLKEKIDKLLPLYLEK